MMMELCLTFASFATHSRFLEQGSGKAISAPINLVANHPVSKCAHAYAFGFSISF